MANVKQQSQTCDAFLGGRLQVRQPRAGFRAGTESVLLGASVARPGRLLDMGCGAGVAALTALAHIPELAAILFDSETEMVALAQSNLERNGVAAKAEALAFTLGQDNPAQSASPLAPDSFDTVIANPPFFDPAEATVPRDKARARARHMPDEALDAWVRAAATFTAPKGEAIFLHEIVALPGLLSALDRRFGAIRILPLAPRPGAEAKRVLIRAQKASRAPLRLLPPLTIHGPTGRAFSPVVEAVTRGQALLDWSDGLQLTT